MQMRNAAQYGRETFREFMRSHKAKVVFSLTPDARIGLVRILGLQGMGTALMEAMLRIGANAVLVADDGHNEMIKAQAVELIGHIQDGNALPLIIKACPKWKQTVLLENPEWLPCFSDVKLRYAASPVERGAAVRIMVIGCAAQKAEWLERLRNEQSEHVITARELANWLVHEAAVKQPYAPYIEKSGCGEHKKDRLLEVLGAAMAQCEGGQIKPGELSLAPSERFGGVCEGLFEMTGKKIRVASVRGADNANAMLREIKEQELAYHLLEVLSCVGSDC